MQFVKIRVKILNKMNTIHTYQIEFLKSFEEPLAFELSSTSKDTIDYLASHLLSIFAGSKNDATLMVKPLQINTQKIVDSIQIFVDSYKHAEPKLNQITSFFKKLQIGEKFCFFPNQHISPEERLQCQVYLESLSTRTDFKENMQQINELRLGNLMQNYDPFEFGRKKDFIGQGDKSKRVCRFCSNDNSKVTFKGKAHAISEALGNKKVILYDECDQCNEKFSETIEPDIVNYLAAYRTFFGVKGKGGTKSFKGENFSLKPDKQKERNTILEIDDSEEEKGHIYKLKTGKKIKLQNIYKALCKYVLSVIDEKDLHHFTKTIDWINDTITFDTLPKVARMISNTPFSPEPKLAVYLRKNDNEDIPFAIGEFYFTCFVFTFLIPLNDEYNTKFASKEGYQKYLEMFSHYEQTDNWIFHDFSDNKERSFDLTLKFEINDQNTPS